MEDINPKYRVGDVVEIKRPGYTIGRGRVERVELLDGKVLYITSNYGHLSIVKEEWITGYWGAR